VRIDVSKPYYKIMAAWNLLETMLRFLSRQKEKGKEGAGRNLHVRNGDTMKDHV
jgi:hypothetical protein